MQNGVFMVQNSKWTKETIKLSLCKHTHISTVCPNTIRQEPILNAYEIFRAIVELLCYFIRTCFIRDSSYCFLFFSNSLQEHQACYIPFSDWFFQELSFAVQSSCRWLQADGRTTWSRPVPFQIYIIILLRRMTFILQVFFLWTMREWRYKKQCCQNRGKWIYSSMSFSGCL